MIGVLSTMILVAGSAANSAFSLGMDTASIIGSCLLPILGGGLALLLSYLRLPKDKEAMNETSRRTLVVETLSKSPTLAYVLARKHFGQSAATVPAAGMISLAIIGAVVASVWSMVAPIDETS
jgi:BASS family bile acid:Na+ symporter